MFLNWILKKQSVFQQGRPHLRPFSDSLFGSVNRPFINWSEHIIIFKERGTESYSFMTLKIQKHLWVITLGWCFVFDLQFVKKINSIRTLSRKGLCTTIVNFIDQNVIERDYHLNLVYFLIDEHQLNLRKFFVMNSSIRVYCTHWHLSSLSRQLWAKHMYSALLLSLCNFICPRATFDCASCSNQIQYHWPFEAFMDKKQLRLRMKII